MNIEQSALKVFEEELGELAIELLQLQQRVSKAVRFGVDEIQHGYTSNKERIEAEWNDVLGALSNLAKVGLNLQPDVEAIAAKQSKIEHYSKYSQSLGMVTEEPANSTCVKHLAVRCWCRECSAPKAKDDNNEVGGNQISDCGCRETKPEDATHFAEIPDGFIYYKIDGSEIKLWRPYSRVWDDPHGDLPYNLALIPNTELGESFEGADHG